MIEKSHDAFDRALMMEWIETMSGFGPRRTGSAAGLKNEDFLLEKLKDFGLENVHKPLCSE